MVRALQANGWRWPALARRLALLLGAVLALGSGCPTEHYRLQMRAQGGMLERVLADLSTRAVPRPPSASGAGPAQDAPDAVPPLGFAADAAAALVLHYGPPGPLGEFRRQFAPGALPPDPLGSAFWWLQSSSPLGAVYRYQERLAGRESAVSFAQSLQGSDEQAAELLGGWLREELGADPAAAQVERIVREHWLPDLCELAWLSWLSASDLLPEADVEPRLAQFLLEHGYIELTPGAGSPLQEIEYRVLALTDLRRRGVPLGSALQRWLAAPEDEVKASVQRHVVRSAPFRSWLAEPGRAAPHVRAALGAFGSSAAPELDHEGDELLAAYLAERFPAALRVLGAFAALGAQGDVEVSLALPAAPFASNGRWDAEQGRLHWEKRSLFAGPELSGLLHASWSEPASDFQQAHFGRVLLAQEPLHRYNEWYRALGPARREAWDRFAEQLTPGPQLRARLAGFRFEDDEPLAPDAAPGPHGAARTALELLLEALDARPPA
jgi:hypothetical protein